LIEQGAMKKSSWKGKRSWSNSCRLCLPSYNISILRWLFSRTYLTSSFFVVTFMASFIYRIYCLRKHPQKSIMERIFQITTIILMFAVLAIFAVFV